MDRKLAVILAIDVVGYSTLMERDEAGTHERVTAGRQELFQPEIERHHGRVFQLMGDGLLAEFTSVVDAVASAVALQRGLAERNAAVPEDQRFTVRIGINLGEVIVEGDDRYGEHVNIAVRLQQLAEPGGICVSGKVAKEVEKKLAFSFEPMGEQKVKNIAEPVEAFRVKLDGMPARRIAPAAAKRLRPWAATIAVLPFDDISPEKNLAYLGDGIAEDIITMLARSPDMSVVARHSSFAYQDKQIDIRKLGAELGAEYVLEGSVRRRGDRLCVVARLSDALAGVHLWAERFEETGADPWIVEGRIAETIVTRLAGDCGELEKAQYREAWGKDVASLSEFDYYLRGQDLLTKTYQKIATNAEYDRAGQIWRQGLAVYPDSPLLKIGLGRFYFERPTNYTSEDPHADFLQGGRLAQEVLAEPTLSPYVRKKAGLLMALACQFAGDFPAASRHAKEALELAPHDVGLRGTIAAQVYLSAGRLDAASEIFSRAMPSDEASESCYKVRWGLTHLLAGENETALNFFQQAWYHHSARSLAGVALVRLGRLGEARIAIADLLKHDPAFTQAKWRNCHFYSDPAIIAAQCADLAKAGLPEK